MECCEPTQKGHFNLQYIQCLILLENARWQMLTYVHFLEIVTLLLQTLVVHTDSSTFKLYKIAQYIKVGCMEPEEFWLPTW